MAAFNQWEVEDSKGYKWIVKGSSSELRGEVMDQQERWEDINNFEDKYQISSFGRVRNKKNDKILKGSVVNGYKMVTLISTDRVSSQKKVHQLVAEHFVRWTGYKRVKFADGDKLNCSSSNLIW